MRNTRKVGAGRAFGAAAALALLGAAGSTFADPPTTMAPPVEPGYSQPNYDSANDSVNYDSANYDSAAYDAPAEDGAVSVASQDSVFNWREVPAQQRVPVRRAVFDQGGYQLYDTAGETIVVPFTNHNLYVMKFAPSDDGTTYFVNEGDAPVLYVPRGGYLENASAPGARWYPFSKDFRPSEPVFVGIAPSWDEFCNMGWYPHMVFYGGYWGDRPFLSGGVFLPSIGLSIFIGGHPYYGWEPYHEYFRYHEAPYHVTIVNRNVYRFGGRPYGDHAAFRGGGRGYDADRHFGGDRTFTTHSFGGDRTFGGGRSYRATDPAFTGGRTFNGGRGMDGVRNTNQGHTFSGNTGPTYYAHHNFSGGRDFTGAQPVTGDRTFGGGGRSFGGNSRPLGGGSFGGGQTPYQKMRAGQGGDRAFSGGARSYSGGGRSSSGGGRSYSGGGHVSSGGNSSGGRDSRGGDGGHR